jgi:large subunit ribosomal protein L4
VSGGGRKPWRQKGTGRARQGSIRSPLWVGGGVVFGPKSRDYTYRLPKKVRRQALRSALSLKYGESRLKVLENIEFMRISTKAFHEFMKRLNLQKPLFVVEKKDEILEKSARNIPYTKVLRVEGINVYDVMRYDEIVFTLPALRNLEGTLS